MEVTREPAARRSVPLVLALFQPGMESLMKSSREESLEVSRVMSLYGERRLNTASQRGLCGSVQGVGGEAS